MFSSDYVVPGLRNTGGSTFENNGNEHGTVQEALVAAKMQALAHGGEISLVFNGHTVIVHGDSRVEDLYRAYTTAVNFYVTASLRGGTCKSPIG